MTSGPSFPSHTSGSASLVSVAPSVSGTHMCCPLPFDPENCCLGDPLIGGAAIRWGSEAVLERNMQDVEFVLENSCLLQALYMIHLKSRTLRYEETIHDG